MRALGWILMVVGLGLCAWGFFFDPSVESSSGFDRINNLGLMQTQMMIFNGGGFVAVAGAAFAAAGEVVEELKPKKRGPAP